MNQIMDNNKESQRYTRYITIRINPSPEAGNQIKV